MHHAYCWRSGIIAFGETVPEGTIPFDQDRNEQALKDRVAARARHAYDGATLLVPGIPEADTDDEALAALDAFVRFLRQGRRKAVAA